MERGARIEHLSPLVETGQFGSESRFSTRLKLPRGFKRDNALVDLEIDAMSAVMMSARLNDRIYEAYFSTRQDAGPISDAHSFLKGKFPKKKAAMGSLERTRGRRTRLEPDD